MVGQHLLDGARASEKPRRLLRRPALPHLPRGLAAGRRSACTDWLGLALAPRGRPSAAAVQLAVVFRPDCRSPRRPPGFRL
eukprot:7613520-Pyramimonas_sp.AAC.1